jgi:hypothetical protein
MLYTIEIMQLFKKVKMIIKERNRGTGQMFISRGSERTRNYYIEIFL